MAEVAKPNWIDYYDLHLPSAQKNAPIFSIPDGKIHTTINRRKDQDGLDIIGRAGIQAVMDYRDDNRKFNFEWTHSNIFNNSGKAPATGTYGTASLSEQDCINVARTIGLNVIEADELGEGDPWGMPYYADQKRWFYQERARMYQAVGRSYPSYGTYGGFENFNGDPWLFKTGGNQNVLPNSDSAPFKGYIQTLAGARGSCAYFGLFESIGLGAIIKNYADSADYQADYYRKAFAAEVMGKGGGRVGGLGGSKLAYLDWGNMEQLPDGNDGPGSLHNGLNFQRTKPNGEVLVVGGLHPPVDYEWLVGCAFMIGYVRTNGCIPFNERILYSSNPADNDYPMEGLSYQNSSFEGAYRYAQCERTAGVGWQQMKYRFAGSEQWIEPKTDGTTILDHASAFGGPYAKGNTRRGRPDAVFRVKNNALDFALFDASQSKLHSETIIVQPLPGKEFEVNLRSGVLHQRRETI